MVNVLLDKVEAAGASVSMPCTTYSKIRIHVFSDTVSVATVKVQVSLDNDHWKTTHTITNPTGKNEDEEAGDLVTVESATFVRVLVSDYTSGKITAKMETYPW